jgi:threonylcarbamoyladenosine tRNA methylthiotransferase MtaB
VVIVNTCTVTRKAAMQSRQAVRQAVRANPGARIVVTGCHAQTAPAELAAIDGVDLVVGNRDKCEIPRQILSGIPRHAGGEPCLRARTSALSANSTSCPESPTVAVPVRF